MRRYGSIILGILLGELFVPRADALMIESPIEGQTVVVGEPFKLVVRPASGEACKSIGGELLKNPATGTFEYTEIIKPNDAIGRHLGLYRYGVLGEALDDKSTCLNASVTITVVLPPTTVVQSIHARFPGADDQFTYLDLQLTPEEKLFAKTNHQILVEGLYSDGVERDISVDPQTTYQSLDQKIATVSVKEGKVIVTAEGAGITEIIVSNGPYQDRLGVSVKEVICLYEGDGYRCP